MEELETFNFEVPGSSPGCLTIHQLVFKIYEPFDVEGISKRVDEGRYLGKDRIAQGPYLCQIDQILLRSFIMNIKLHYTCKYCSKTNEITGLLKWFCTPHFGAKKMDYV